MVPSDSTLGFHIWVSGLSFLELSETSSWFNEFSIQIFIILLYTTCCKPTLRIPSLVLSMKSPKISILSSMSIRHFGKSMF